MRLEPTVQRMQLMARAAVSRADYNEKLAWHKKKQMLKASEAKVARAWKNYCAYVCLPRGRC